MANDLEVKIKADMREFSATMQTLQSQVGDLSERLKKSTSASEQGFNRLNSTVQNTVRAIAGLVSVQAGLSLTKSVIETADSYQQLNGRLKLASEGTTDLATAQKDLFGVAQSTGTSITGTVDLYNKLARSTKNLKLSEQELIAVTKTTNQLIQLSGASSEASAAAMQQFGQALGGPKFQAEELNSIIEQTPELARAIERGLGLISGSLKQYAEKTGLTAQQAVGALLKVSNEVDNQFSSLPDSVGRAMTRLQNEVTQAVGKTDLSPLVSALDDLRETVSDPAVITGIQDIATALVKLASTSTEAAASVANFSKWVGESLASAVNGPAADDLVRVSDRIDLLKKRIQSLEDAPLSFLNKDRIQEYRTELEQLEASYTKFSKAQGLPAAGAQSSGSASAGSKTNVDLKAQADAQLAAGKAALEKAKADEAAATKEKQRKDAIENLLKSLEKESSVYGKTAAEAAVAQLALLGATDAEKERARALGAQVDTLKAKEQAEKDATKAAKEAEQTAKELARAEEQIAKQRSDVMARYLAASGDQPAAKALQLKTEYEKLINDLTARGDVAGVEIINKLINLEVADARLAQLRDKISSAKDGLKNTEESVGNRVISGDTPAPTGQAEIGNKREQTIAELQQYRGELAQLAAKDVPGATTELQKLDEEIKKIQDQSVTGFGKALRDLRAEFEGMKESFAGDSVGALRDSLGGFFNDLVEGSKSGEDALKDFVRGFASSMAQIATRALATFVVLQLLDAVYPGLGQATAATMSVAQHHTGGIAGQGGKRVQAGEYLFAAAPRYHVGGIAGFKPGEVPAVLMKGEEVLTQNDPRHVANGGKSAGGGRNIRIVNVMDPSLIHDQMSSSAGEEIHMNHIQRNIGKIKMLMGIV